MKKTVLLCVLGAMTFGMSQSFAQDQQVPSHTTVGHVLQDGDTVGTITVHRRAGGVIKDVTVSSSTNAGGIITTTKKIYTGKDSLKDSGLSKSDVNTVMKAGNALK